jgi:hypothetical protein
MFSLSLAVLVTLPLMIAIHLRRVRPPVRSVAGLFLWKNPNAFPSGTSPRNARVVLLRDVAVVAAIAALAAASMMVGERPMSMLVRASLCAVAGTLLVCNWRGVRHK